MFFVLLLHALSLRSFGEPYLAPVSPFRPSEQRDLLLRLPLWMKDRRPSLHRIRYE
ncbi:spore germination protein [Bacillus sp. 3255]|uniref:spore germination protein n=1 Tax=Bacillus sp. 3255 TaxID=2817904 RepID=UPI00286A362E|nr:spore germination protein [Bacillus sp. 3255]